MNQPAVWTFYDRDALGRVWQISSPNKTGSAYDSGTYTYNGLSRTSRNAKGQTRTDVRNALGKLKSVTDAYGSTTNYVYEAFGNLARTVDPKGNRIDIGNDRLGRKTAMDDPNLGHWSYVVDPVGQTRRQVDARQQTTTYEFDALGRMTQRLEPDLDSRWEYDTAAHGVGELAEAYTWAGGSKDYRRVHSYDAYGRPSSTVTSLDWDYASTVTYDGFGRPDKTIHSRAARGAGTSDASNSFQRHYNALGYQDRIDRFEGASAAATLVYATQAVDADGRATQEQLGNGVVSQRGYNAYTGRLNSIRSGPAANNPTYQNDAYDYDVLGNLESRSQLIANAGGLLGETFTYDSLNRLSTSTIGGVVKVSTYDETGNLTSKTGLGLYRYPPSGAGSAGPNAMRGVEGVVAGLTNPNFSYDENGNLKAGLARSYAWTSFNMPSSIDKLDGVNAVQRTAFIYDAEHGRTRQTISPMSAGVPGASTTTIWYGAGVEKEIDAIANTTTIRTSLPQDLGFIEEKFNGAAIAATASGTRSLRYFLTDHLGSTLVVMDQSQGVLQRMSYDAWGRRRNVDGTDDGGPLWGSLKNAQDHSGYTGHEHLDQLELVNMNARMYDPLLGRHTSADPTVPDAANAQAFNRYSYVMNNALAFTDPTGLSFFDAPCASSYFCTSNGVEVHPAFSDGTASGIAIREMFRNVKLGDKQQQSVQLGQNGEAQKANEQGGAEHSEAMKAFEIKQINRGFATAMATGDIGLMRVHYDNYVALTGEDPSSALNVVRMSSAIMRVQIEQGIYDLAPLAPAATAVLRAGLIGGFPGPKLGNSAANGAAEMVRIGELIPTHGKTMGNKQLDKLVKRIRAEGIKEPLTVTEHQGKLYILDGHHRALAAPRAGVADVPIKRVELPFGAYKTPADLTFTPGGY